MYSETEVTTMAIWDFSCHWCPVQILSNDIHSLRNLLIICIEYINIYKIQLMLLHALFLNIIELRQEFNVKEYPIKSHISRVSIILHIQSSSTARTQGNCELMLFILLKCKSQLISFRTYRRQWRRYKNIMMSHGLLSMLHCTLVHSSNLFRMQISIFNRKFITQESKIFD